MSREDKKRQQLAELGIEYDFDGYRGSGKAQDKSKDEEEPAAKPTPKKKGRKSAGGDEVRAPLLCSPPFREIRTRAFTFA